MERHVKISAARARLFELVDTVIGSDDEVVLLEHRDRPERAALVSERYLRYLQQTIAELRRYGDHPFRLAGSVRLGEGGASALDAAFSRQGETARGRPGAVAVAVRGGAGEVAAQLVPALATSSTASPGEG